MRYHDRIKESQCTHQVNKTTAHSLAFAFALLALYQDEQEKLYKHIKSVVKDGGLPVRIPFFNKVHTSFDSFSCRNTDLRRLSCLDIRHSVSLFMVGMSRMILTGYLSVLYEPLRLFPPVSANYRPGIWPIFD